MPVMIDGTLGVCLGEHGAEHTTHTLGDSQVHIRPGICTHILRRELRHFCCNTIHESVFHSTLIVNHVEEVKVKSCEIITCAE